MNGIMKTFLALMIVCFGLTGVFAQNNNAGITKTNLSQPEIDRIIKNVVTKEQEFRQALANYVFNRSATVQTIGMGGQITGEFRQDSFMSLTPSGERFQKIIFAPASTLMETSMTQEDLEDLGGVNAFALEPGVVNQYSFTYVGKEKIDDLNLYVFDIAPKVMPDAKKTKQRFFAGRIWIDDQDLQIVKSKGKALPETKDNKFPIVETWRENVDGKYWFPAYASVTGTDGELVFDNGNVLRLKMEVKYSNYKQGKAEVVILDDVVDESTPTPAPTPTPKKP